MLMAVKAVTSALLIVGINAVAQRNAYLAGWIASLPLVTLVSIAWLAFDRRGDAEIVKFLAGVLWGLVPTTFLLIVCAGLLTLRAPLAVAVALGLAAGAAGLLAARALGLLSI